MRPFFAKIGRHVTYWTASRKPRPATITGVTGAATSTLAAQANAGAVTLSSNATAAIGQWIVLDYQDPNLREERRISNVTGAGPFTLTVPAISFTHLSGAKIYLEPTSLNLRMPRNLVGSAQTVSSVVRRVNHADTNVWSAS